MVQFNQYVQVNECDSAVPTAGGGSFLRRPNLHKIIKFNFYIHHHPTSLATYPSDSFAVFTSDRRWNLILDLDYRLYVEFLVHKTQVLFRDKYIQLDWYVRFMFVDLPLSSFLQINQPHPNEADKRQNYTEKYRSSV